MNPPVVEVICLLCNQAMQPFRKLASVVHHYKQPMGCLLVLYRCSTPDCGNEVIVEDR